MDAASGCGFRVERGDAAYASTDGKGTILVGPPETLDADDSLCQLVLHELCHALVQGEQSWTQVDWGLCNTDDRDDVAEAACLRLQAHLAAGAWPARGARARPPPGGRYYQALPADAAGAPPTAPTSCACALRAAGARPGRAARARAGDPPRRSPRPPRWLAARRRPAGSADRPSRAGFPLGPADQTCGTCAWRYLGGRGAPVERCRQTAPEVGDGRRVRPSLPACDRWEPPVDCDRCGACCREAYHSVERLDARSGGLEAAGPGRAQRAPLQPAARGRSLRRPAAVTDDRAITARSTRTGRAPAATSSGAGGTAWWRAGGSASRAEHRIPWAPIVDLFVPIAEAETPLAELAARALGRERLAARGGAAAAPVARRPQGPARWATTCGSRCGRPTDRARGPAPARPRPRWPAGRPQPERSSCSARARRARSPRSGWPRPAWPAPSSSGASRCSRAGAIWRPCSGGPSIRDSNYCFGEGGAGTYSDGKLYTRSKDRGDGGPGAGRSGSLRRPAARSRWRPGPTSARTCCPRC